MLPRWQLPVHSPIGIGDLASGAADLVLGGRGADVLRAEIRRSYDADDVLLCSSGTHALQIALLSSRASEASPLSSRASAAREGSIAPPAYCCYDVATAAVGAGCKIALYDIDPETLTPNLDSLRRVFISGGSVAVIAPLYGVPIPWEPLEALAAEYGATLIEDAAQGHGALWRGRPLGSLGRLSVLSFGRGKGWTGGKGGALLARGGAELPDVDLPGAPWLDDAFTYGVGWAQWALGRPTLYAIPSSVPGLELGETHYREPSAPRQIPRTAPAMLLHSRNAATESVVIRRRNGEMVLAMLEGSREIETIQIHPDATPGYLRLPMLLQSGMTSLPDPDRAKKLGIAPGYPTTLGALEAVQNRLTGPETIWPGADRLVRDLVTLPTHSRLRRDETTAIAGFVRRPNPNPGHPSKLGLA